MHEQNAPNGVDGVREEPLMIAKLCISELMAPFVPFLVSQSCSSALSCRPLSGDAVPGVVECVKASVRHQFTPPVSISGPLSSLSHSTVSELLS